MRPSIPRLIEIADAFRRTADGMPESTLSYRIFGDTKRLGALRDGREITVGRYNHALDWFDAHWPADVDRPAALIAASPATPKDADAGEAA
jgi:hypothetical protein